jgi:hypothetical protein
MTDHNTYWFPAKRFGWGWGPPTRWQGWAALGASLFAMAIGALVLLPVHVVGFLSITIAVTALLLLICYAKGEPPAWRWGDRR